MQLPARRSLEVGASHRTGPLCLAAVLVCGWWAVAAPTRAGQAITPEQEEFFERRVRPVLVDQCYRCHGEDRQRGGLRVDSRAALLHGTDLGPAIVPGEPDTSRLVEAVRYEGDLQMPPLGKLPDEQIEALTAWVEMGAPWPEADAAAADVAYNGDYGAMIDEARRTHWSFQPVVEPRVPDLDDYTDSHGDPWVATPIDAFVLAAMQEQGLKPSPPADRRTLIRRAYFDLIGLPPTPEEIDAFVNDTEPGAFERVIDRLLDSPHYGERWGRHWLDVARYADTKGYVFNEERKYIHGYTYRDYVIRAFNEDKPYDEFIIEQLAADHLPLEDDPRPLAAMGYLTLGRRFVNNQHDIIDDRIDVVTRGMMGLTVSCARCHDHKHDPIPTADYYALYGIFANSMEPKELPLVGEPEENEAYHAYQEELHQRREAYETFARETHDAMIDEFRENVGAYLAKVTEGRDASLTDGVFVYMPGEIRAQIVDRWHDYLTESAPPDDPVFAPWHALMALADDDDFAGRAADVIADLGDRQQGNGQATRINSLVLAALRENPPASMTDVAEAYGNLLAGVHREWRAVFSERTDEEETGGAAHASDDAPSAALPDPAAEQLRQVLYGPDAPVVISPDFAAKMFVYDRTVDGKLASLRQRVADWEKESTVAPPRAHVLVDRPNIREHHIFVRGNPGMRGDVAERRFLQVLSNGNRQPFTNGSGRLELARAIADASNPLTARVKVNRIWHHHFGAGLVRTPSDFGLRGDPPTHPEMLDYLAARFMDEGWSIKSMHRLIMRSSVYRQRSDDREACRMIDPDNRLLWRMNRRRLDFEAMRDAMLSVAGRLDLTPGGPSVEITTPPFSTRRTVYAFIERQNLPGVFRTFDFASPDTTSPRRFLTTVPQQALFMMNSPFVIEQARHLAAREEAASAATPEARVQALHRLVYGREADAREIERALAFIRSPALIKEAAETNARAAWSYGYGRYDPSASALEAFHPLAHFADGMWRAGEPSPHPDFGYLQLTADGGHVGTDGTQSAVRRWTAPVAGVVEIQGALVHGRREGNGVQAWISSSRHGELGHWTAHGSRAETMIWRLEVRPGDTVDFVVDGRGDHSFDTFKWAPTIRLIEPASADDDADGGDGENGATPDAPSWSAQRDFAGPRPEPLNPWEQYAQVLLMTNEFMFID